eukprot:6463661-Amphidinium_carterae.1
MHEIGACCRRQPPCRHATVPRDVEVWCRQLHLTASQSKRGKLPSTGPCRSPHSATASGSVSAQ